MLQPFIRLTAVETNHQFGTFGLLSSLCAKDYSFLG